MSAHDVRVALRKVLNLIVDSAIAADDAIARDDPENLATAIEALATNSNSAKDLAAAWQAHHAGMGA